jgi:hypothetical protein
VDPLNTLNSVLEYPVLVGVYSLNTMNPILVAIVYLLNPVLVGSVFTESSFRLSLQCINNKKHSE